MQEIAIPRAATERIMALRQQIENAKSALEGYTAAVADLSPEVQELKHGCAIHINAEATAFVVEQRECEAITVPPPPQIGEGLGATPPKSDMKGTPKTPFG